VCVPCPVGEYQPMDLQDSCLKCKTNYTTMSTGKNSMTDCKCMWNLLDLRIFNKSLENYLNVAVFLKAFISCFNLLYSTDTCALYYVIMLSVGLSVHIKVFWTFFFIIMVRDNGSKYGHKHPLEEVQAKFAFQQALCSMTYFTYFQAFSLRSRACIWMELVLIAKIYYAIIFF
jgi:hypothetical protein